MIFDDSKPHKSTYFPLNWGVDYTDGTYLKEFHNDDENCRNNFYNIDTSKIKRFGLFGNNIKMFYDDYGSLYIKGKKVDVEYHLNGEEHVLTYNRSRDCITFKDAHINVNKKKEAQDNILDSINFGYKTLVNINGSDIFFQPIISFTTNGELILKVKITSNVDMNGKLIFKIKDKIVDEYDFPVEEGYSSNIDWYM